MSGGINSRDSDFFVEGKALLFVVTVMIDLLLKKTQTTIVVIFLVCSSFVYRLVIKFFQIILNLLLAMLYTIQNNLISICGDLIRDQSILLFFLPIFLSSNSFIFHLLCSIFCSRIINFAQH